jgi:carbon starvation protein CstA
MDIDWIKIGLIILIPALFIMIICLLFIIPDVYSEEWHFEDEETLPPTPKEKLIESLTFVGKVALYTGGLKIVTKKIGSAGLDVYEEEGHNVFESILKIFSYSK